MRQKQSRLRIKLLSVVVTMFREATMPIRRLILIFTLLVLSFSVQAQQSTPEEQAAAQQLMLQKMDKVVLSALTQKDVGVFIKVVETSKNLKLTNKSEWEAIDTLAPVEREKKINELSNLAGDEDYLVSMMRIQIAIQANDPAQIAQIKQQYEVTKQQVSAAKAQMRTLPEEQKRLMEKQMNLSLKMMEMMVNYPKEGIDVYKSNKAKIDEGIQFLEQE